jgi:glucose-6-phosphate isomerase
MQHDITRALTADIAPRFEAQCAALAPHQARYGATPLAHMSLAARTDDVAAMQDMAAALGDGAARILILGTGGSSLGAQVLAQVTGWGTPAGPQSGPQLIFVDNLDADSYGRLLHDNLAETRFFVVSKSGGTAETMMQLGGALMALARDGLSPKSHIAGIAGSNENAHHNAHHNALRRLAATHGFALLDHDEDIGGRFSVLSNVGLLPAIWAGLDPLRVRAGACDLLARLGDKDFAPLQGAALQLAHMQAGRNISVIMPYADRLDRLAFWYRQLWAESLGKKGLGSVPVNALGPVDQHSQVQLYMDGPDDKFYSFITHATRDSGPGVPDMFAEDPALAPLAGHCMGNLVEAEARGTMDVLAKAGRPVRHIAITQINDESVGALLMHFQLEVIFAADGLGVNAFDQPAVEAGKIRAKHYLDEMR